jgi:hypothetical protein
MTAVWALRIHDALMMPKNEALTLNQINKGLDLGQ